MSMAAGIGRGGGGVKGAWSRASGSMLGRHFRQLGGLSLADAKAAGDFKCVPKPAGPVTRSQAANNKKPAKCDPKKGVIVAPEGSTPNVVCCTKPGVKPAWKHKCRDVGKPAGDVEAPRSVCCKN